MLQDMAAWEMTDAEITGAVSGRGSGEARDDSSTGSAPANTAIIPVGSIEQHGPHLPVSTDSIIASEVARMVSVTCGYLLLPVMSYGVSYEHAPLFHASVAAGSLRAALCDLGASLGAYGVGRLIVINGHHGNMDALDGLDTAGGSCKTVNRSITSGAGGACCADSSAQIRVFHYWRHMQQELGHAGFTETSMMLAISPGLVRMDLAQKGLVTDGMPHHEVRRLSNLAKESFVRATGNGVWGDPTGATATAGRKMLEAAAVAIADACRDACGRQDCP